MIMLSGLLGAAMLVSAGCGRTVQNTDEQIRTLPATKGHIEDTVIFVGNITSAQTSTLTWETTGVISDVTAALGDTVTRDQILATLETDSLTAQVLSAEKPLWEARDELDELLLSDTAKAQAYKDAVDAKAALATAEKHRESINYPKTTSSEIAYWKDQVDIYRQEYDDAVENFNSVTVWEDSPDEDMLNLYESKRQNMLNKLNRYAEVYNTYLYYSGKASDNDREQADADVKKAKADYEKALKTWETFSVYPRQKDINAAELKLSNAEDTYNRRSIVSDINGTITSISARPGDYVKIGSSAFRIDNLDHLYIPIDISEIDIVGIRDGMKASIVLDADTSKTYDGIVRKVSASGSGSESRVTFETMVELLEPDETVRIGMTAEVNIILNDRNDALLVPANSLVTVNGETYVTVSGDRGTKEVPVKVGIVTDTIAEITGGDLREGDEVQVPSVDNSILKAMGLSPELPETDQMPPMDGNMPPMNGNLPPMNGNMPEGMPFPENLKP